MFPPACLGKEKPAILPHTAVLLRVHPEHLDWHEHLEEYLEAKGQLLALGSVGDGAKDGGIHHNQPNCPSDQRVIYCLNSEYNTAILASRQRSPNHPEVLGFFRGTVPKNCVLKQGIHCSQHQVERVYLDGSVQVLFASDALRMAGPFNMENASAAWLAVEPLITPLGSKALQAALQAIQNFRGLPHHLEHVKTRFASQRGEWDYYNDSFSTRPQAAIGALETFARPVVMLLGGSDKGVTFFALAKALCQHKSLAGVVLIGATAHKIEQALHHAAQVLGCALPAIKRAGSLKQAIAAAEHILPCGGAIVLSPACASFDMFANYKTRGDTFCALVRERAATPTTPAHA